MTGDWFPVQRAPDSYPVGYDPDAQQPNARSGLRIAPYVAPVAVQPSPEVIRLRAIVQRTRLRARRVYRKSRR